MTAARVRIAGLALVIVAAAQAAPVQAQPPPAAQTQAAVPPDLLEDTPSTDTQIERLTEAAGRLPIAAGLAAALALRPRRRGTPARQPSVIQTQIILAIIGALVMLVVGSSLARAFGIVGAAGLVRYRAKVDNTKDAGVMLSTLTVGLAAGVGLWLLAIFGTLFILAVLWAVESFEPQATRLLMLKVKTKDPTNLKGRIEQLLRRHHATFEVRTVAQEELQFVVHWPFERHTDRVSEAILELNPRDETEVEWEEKSLKK
jgi:hypothetical protein